jgi:hypothetical protein
MPNFEETPLVKPPVDEAGFDTSELDVSFSRPIQLCAMEVSKLEDNNISINPTLKNVGLVDAVSVNKPMDMTKDFKYSARFDNIIIQAMVPFEEDKYLAVASVDKLAEYLPQNIDLDVNRDLMGVAFDAFVVNRGNKNGHIISTEVALDMIENFVSKPFNIEHNRKVVVGVCTGYGFSEFGTSKPLTLNEVKAMTEPFNVVLSGYVWKVVNPEFADELVVSSDPSSEKYLSVSASWELGFNEFNIAKGSKNLGEATIIEDTEEIMKEQNSLKVFGGSGVSKDGESVMLNLQGSVLPLGIGFTNNPAAEVAGVAVSVEEVETEVAATEVSEVSDELIEEIAATEVIAEEVEVEVKTCDCDGDCKCETTEEVVDEVEEVVEAKDYSCESCSSKGIKADVCPVCGSDKYFENAKEVNPAVEEVEANEINSVPVDNKNVKNIMHIKKVDDITEDSIKEIEASAVREFISTQITELASEWQSKIEDKETELTAAKDEVASLKADLELVKAESLQTQTDLAKVQEEIKTSEIESTFQRRMNGLDEEFNLTDEDRTIIVEELRTFASEESFSAWYKKFSTFAEAKKKTASVEVKAEEVVTAPAATVEVQASAEEAEVKAEVIAEQTVEEVISSVEAKEDASLPNASSPQEATLVEKINAAFNKTSVKIK